MYSYHHTISTTLLYGLREALAIFCEEGLAATIQRHQEASVALQKGIEALGLEMLIKSPELRMPTVNVVIVPSGVNWKMVTDYIMAQ